MDLALIALTGLIILLALASAYTKSRDPLNPIFVLAPLFLYSYSVEPLALGDTLDLLPRSGRDFVALVNLLCVGALFFGINRRNLSISREPGQLVHEVYARHLLILAKTLVLIGLLAYGSGIWSVGGFFSAYNSSKGGGHFASGYIGEAVHLGLVAALVIGAIHYRRGMPIGVWIFVLLGILPNLMQGTFGGRRGPIYLSLMSLILVWFLSSRRRPNLLKLGIGFSVVLAAVIFVQSQRKHLYLGSDNANIDWSSFVSALRGTEGGKGSNYIYGSAFMLVAWDTGKYTFGKEIFVNVVIRPIPRQIWPTKYQDIGWQISLPGFGQFSASEWVNAVGWVPSRGSSSGVISDLFGEFGIAAILAMFAIGYGIGELRRRSLTSGGVWQFLYLETIVLSIYLATQSFSAFYHRWLVLAVPTILLFYFLDRRLGHVKKYFLAQTSELNLDTKIQQSHIEHIGFSNRRS